MMFHVVERVPKPLTNHIGKAFLVIDRWDDWRKFRTQFYLVFVNSDGQSIDLGSLKIGQAGLEGSSTIGEGKRVPEIPQSFESLDERFFSLGQDETYYESIQQLDYEAGKDILVALRDVAYDTSLFRRFADEEVMRVSLLRSVTPSTVVGRFSRLARGDAELTKFDFQYSLKPAMPGEPATVLSFTVEPYRNPPTNVHVLIGRNGSGKTRFLQGLASTLVGAETESARIGDLTLIGDNDPPWAFASLVYVSFSAFDGFELPPPRLSTLKAAQVSLRGDEAVADRAGETTKSGCKSFLDAFAACRRGLRKERWREAVQSLESDPLFEEADVTSLLLASDSRWKVEATKLFSHLSSGHAVVLLTITRLVELVDEHTLVLMDEPEGHLHPPLLSALIRSLSDLLIKRNGVAVIATHSPVVLQEVPMSCVWKLRRAGITSVAERPEQETFGENVGVLTREIFGLEVASSGFHKLISDAVQRTNGDYDEVLELFNGELGGEAKAIARGLAAVERRKAAFDI